MATKYDLRPDEVVLLRDEHVEHAGSGSSYSHELLLTNLNLVLLKKGFFGGSKGVFKFPLNEIKVYDQQAQAVLGKASNGSAVLDVYFRNGQEQFAFGSGGKKKINEWVSKISQVVTGESGPQAGGRVLPGAEVVAGVLKDTLVVFKTRLGSKSDGPVKVAGKCAGCGAPLAGLQGKAITCEYCGSAQQL